MFNQDGKIKQVIINFANRRGLEVTLEEIDGIRQVWIWELENDCEPLLMYLVNNDGSLTYKARLFRKLEDLPAWIDSRQNFYKVLDYVSDMMKAEKM